MCATNKRSLNVRNDAPTVFVIVPTYNRIEFTCVCIDRLLGQTYPHVTVIVSDGGSTDGTQETILAKFPTVIVLNTEKELWWGGAMARGIKWAQENGADGKDCILMMNDDTEFDDELLEKLMTSAARLGAAVAAVTLDSKAPHKIVDAGTYLDWDRYRYRSERERPSGKTERADVDVLPGRATLVPVYMVEKAGNVDGRRFPHYLADYEFFYRLKLNGFRLAVTYETSIRSHMDMTGLDMVAGRRYSLREHLELFSARRSMYNVFDHCRFIALRGPKGKRFVIIMRVAFRMVVKSLKRTLPRHRSVTGGVSK